MNINKKISHDNNNTTTNQWNRQRKTTHREREREQTSFIVLIKCGMKFR